MLLEIDGRAELYRDEERIDEVVDDSTEVDLDEGDVDLTSDGPIGVTLVGDDGAGDRHVEVDGVAAAHIGESDERVANGSTHVPGDRDVDLVSDGPLVVTLSARSAVDERIL